MRYYRRIFLRVDIVSQMMLLLVVLLMLMFPATPHASMLHTLRHLRVLPFMLCRQCCGMNKLGLESSSSTTRRRRAGMIPRRRKSGMLQ